MTPASRSSACVVVADAIRKDPVKWDEVILGYVRESFSLLSDDTQTATFAPPYIQPSQRGLHSNHPQTLCMGRRDRALYSRPALQHRDRVGRRRDWTHRPIRSTARDRLGHPCDCDLLRDTLRRDERRADARRPRGLSPDDHEPRRGRRRQGRDARGGEEAG